MTYIGCTSLNSMVSTRVSTWIVSYLLVYTWHTPLHYPHAANAGCILAGVPGGYSLCDGWYICAAVLTPFFHFGRIEHDLFGVFFEYKSSQNSIFLAPKYHFSLDLFGSNFQWPAATPPGWCSACGRRQPSEVESRGGHSHQLPYGGVPLYRVDFERPVSLK